jgi:hypothetical protein
MNAKIRDIEIRNVDNKNTAMRKLEHDNKKIRNYKNQISNNTQQIVNK